MKLIEMTLADGRRVGLPPLSAIFIAELEADREDGAKTVIRWHVAGGGAQIAEVKDAMRQVLNLFPKSSGGVGWTHGTLAAGRACAFPEGTIASYEEAKDEEGAFLLTLGCLTGPLTLAVKADYDEIQGMLGNASPPKSAPARPAPTRRKPPTPPNRSGGKGKGR